MQLDKKYIRLSCNHASPVASSWGGTAFPRVIVYSTYAIFRFKESMVALVANLKTKDPFYVRCIKPNEIKSPVRFNDERILHQVGEGRGGEGKREEGRGGEGAGQSLLLL